jgi:NADH dehydrogenase FAD-containing subunit
MPVLAILAGIVAGLALLLVGRRRILEVDGERRRRAIEDAGGRLPRVVILGGGLGGLFCARALKNAPVEVVVIDKANHYLYQALIYQVATGLLGEGEVAMPIRERVGGNANTYVVMAEVTGVDVVARKVTVTDGDTYSYDYLVLATGLEPNYFGHEDGARCAPTLKTLEDALELRERILSAFEEAELLDDPATRPELTTFVLVGAGATGVEMAGALADMVRYTLPRDFKRFDPRTARIVLAEAGDRVLPAFSEETSAKVDAKLRAMGVEVRLDSPVECIDAEGAVICGKRIASRNVIWTAGVRATQVGHWAGLATDPVGRIRVNRDLTVPEHPEIYAIGDLAHCEVCGETLPCVAQVALQGGRYVGRSIAYRETGKPPARLVPGGTPPDPFAYFDKGYLATVGRNYAVMETMHGRVKIAGPPAKVIWSFIHLLYQMPNSDKVTMFTKWAWSSATRRLGTRVIVDRPKR